MSGDELIRTIRHRLGAGDSLADEGRLASFARATAWLNSAPLSSEELRGRVVLVDFWTYTCVNWLRTAPYLRAWSAKYATAGLVTVGVHTPEFGFESDLDNVTAHAHSLRIDYPIAVDDGYGIWDDFANRYWPALYLADAKGRIRFHHFGEGEYAMTEMAIQQLLVESGSPAVDTSLVVAEPQGLEVAADWSSLRSPETYLGYGQSTGFVSDDPAHYDRSHHYTGGDILRRNEWDVSGEWVIARHAAMLARPGGRISFAFHARDVNLVLSPGRDGADIRFRVYLDGVPVGPAHGTDVTELGMGVVTSPNTYQLVRQPGRIVDHTMEIEFLDGGVEAYCVTFG